MTSYYNAEIPLFSNFRNFGTTKEPEGWIKTLFVGVEGVHADQTPRPISSKVALSGVLNKAALNGLKFDLIMLQSTLPLSIINKF